MVKILVANWKMHVPDFEGWKKADLKSQKTEAVIAPPFPYLEKVKEILPEVGLGAQDVFWENPPKGGAFTGEVSISMLKDFGVKYAIIGHSEKRAVGETDEIINKKVILALKEGLKVILCVGENLKIRERGEEEVKEFIKNQLQKDLKNLPTSEFSLLNSHLIIAYEPIWAIGTGQNDTPDDALKIIKFIKKILAEEFSISDSKVLYGGSVDSQNVGGFVRFDEIDGALVGGASLDAREFEKMLGVVGR